VRAIGLARVLEDPRLDLRIADARHVLLRDERTYDFVLSQPSHPWRAGASALFTTEFFEIVRERLASGGVFVQWLNLFHMDRTTLTAIGGSFYDVFASGFTLEFMETGDLLLVGSTSAMSIDPERIAARLSRYGDSAALSVAGLQSTGDLLARFSWSRAQMRAAGSPTSRNTDDDLFAEFRLARWRAATLPRDEDPYATLASVASFDVEGLVAPDHLVPLLHDLVERLADDGSLPRARLALERLATVDSAAADGLAPRLAGGIRGRVE
jgi:hypothetical protein